MAAARDRKEGREKSVAPVEKAREKGRELPSTATVMIADRVARLQRERAAIAKGSGAFGILLLGFGCGM